MGETPLRGDAADDQEAPFQTYGWPDWTAMQNDVETHDGEERSLYEAPPGVR